MFNDDAISEYLIRTEKDTLHSTGNINMRRKVRFHYKAIINHWSMHTKLFPMTILLIESICQYHHTVIISFILTYVKILYLPMGIYIEGMIKFCPEQIKED